MSLTPVLSISALGERAEVNLCLMEEDIFSRSAPVTAAKPMAAAGLILIVLSQPIRCWHVELLSQQGFTGIQGAHDPSLAR